MAKRATAADPGARIGSGEVGGVTGPVPVLDWFWFCRSCWFWLFIAASLAAGTAAILLGTVVVVVVVGWTMTTRHGTGSRNAFEAG